MRIISGTLKGRSIDFLKNSNTRPLKDSVRESIFNILYHSNTFKVNIKNSNVLDLYSGIGSFGIECISRGAVRVMFVEQDINAVKILRENLTKLSRKSTRKRGKQCFSCCFVLFCFSFCFVVGGPGGGFGGPGAGCLLNSAYRRL